LGWNVDLKYNPEKLYFWFDFLDSNSKAELSKYGVDKIMDRSKSENEDKASAIYYRDTLNIV